MSTVLSQCCLQRKDVSPGNKTVIQREHEEPTEEISTPLECEPTSALPSSDSVSIYRHDVDVSSHML